MKQSDSTSDIIHYEADFLDHYMHLKDNIRYQVYVVLTTTNGMTFATTEAKIADFYYDKDNSGTSSGGTTLFPILE